MHITDIIARDGATFSFEFFPPRTETGWDALFSRISDFESLAPSFVSVTYGAGGSTRQRTHDTVIALKDRTRLDPIPHLTCVRHSHVDICDILSRYAEAGISNVLALRGDRPTDDPAYQFKSGAMRYASELVAAIAAFNSEKQHPDPRGFGIGVAGFPEGHPETLNRLTEMDHLVAKVEAGADYVCTQLFFDNHAFYDWVERCHLRGLRVPLIAGIMPITSIAGMKRMADLSGGTNFPAALQRAIYRAQDDAEAVERIGIHWATEQCRDLLNHGVDGIHFYTLNQSTATMQIYRTLGARDSADLRQ
ncbi:MAG: methylenetetrahydrofolate reductase [NAD(P)H] [Phycisphaerales bacterium]